MIGGVPFLVNFLEDWILVGLNSHLTIYKIAMASKFSSAETVCEGNGCEAISDVTYYVKEKKKLCDDCASKEGCIGKARKGGPNLYCEKHDNKDIELYCKTHGVGLCYSCALIDHHQQECVRQDIEGAIMENKAKLNALKEQAKDKVKLHCAHGEKIIQCRKDTDTHLQDVKDEVDLAINEATKINKDREQEDAAKINQETDEKNNKIQEEIQRLNEKMRLNNEERKRRLKLNKISAEKRQEPIDNAQRFLHTDIQTISEEKERKIDELEKSCKDDTKTLETTIQTLDTVIEEDKNVVKDGHRVNISVTDELKKPLEEDGVKHITHTVSGVRFVKGVGREKYNGRIDWYDGEWKLIDTINIRDNFLYTAIVGCIDECNLIITDRLSCSVHTYMLDMNTKHTQRVKTGSYTSYVTSCVLLNDDKVVCGKWRTGCTGDSLTGCISVYDRQWKLINDVTIPRNTTTDYTRVHVAVDQDGMIISAEWHQSKIYVINPADNTIINTITCKVKMRMLGVLSSGHIIARPHPADRRVLIIDREGAHREILHSDVIWNICIDPMTDDLYVLTSDDEYNDEYKTCMIDQVMSGGDMKKRRVASFPLTTRWENKDSRLSHIIFSRLMMTSSGKMIACDGDNILIFKNEFSL